MFSKGIKRCLGLGLSLVLVGTLIPSSMVKAATDKTTTKVVTVDTVNATMSKKTVASGEDWTNAGVNYVKGGISSGAIDDKANDIETSLNSAKNKLTATSTYNYTSAIADVGYVSKNDVYVLITPDIPDGYTFTGWTIETDDTDKYYIGSDTNIMTVVGKEGATVATTADLTSKLTDLESNDPVFTANPLILRIPEENFTEKGGINATVTANVSSNAYNVIFNPNLESSILTDKSKFYGTMENQVLSYDSTEKTGIYNKIFDYIIKLKPIHFEDTKTVLNNIINSEPQKKKYLFENILINDTVKNYEELPSSFDWLCKGNGLTIRELKERLDTSAPYA